MPASFSSSLPTTTSLKRKFLIDDDDHESTQPSKLPSIAEVGTGRPTRPLGQNISAVNVSGTRRLGIGPPPLTRPRPPALSGPPPTTITTRPTRATSAPPRSVAPRFVSQPVSQPRPAGVRTVSGPQRPAFNGIGTYDFRFQVSQNQDQPIANSRMAENARLAADMDAERTKVTTLQ